jgi:tetratricopeptide (TPR) repeat protein
VRAFDTIGQVRLKQGRVQEALALREKGLALALEHDLSENAVRMYNNTADTSLQLDRFSDALAIAAMGLELARSRGDRRSEQLISLMIATAEVARGNWDTLPELDERGLPLTGELLRLGYLAPMARVQAGRGDDGALRQTLAVATERSGSTNLEFASGPAVARAIALRALGRPAEALEAALPIATSGPEIANEDRREAYLEAGLAALELGDEQTVERLIQFVSDLPPALRSPLLRAGAARFAGLLAARRGDTRTADERLATAARELREIEAPFVLAQVLLDHAELLREAGQDEDAAPLVSEARAIFAQLRADPWLARVDRLAVAA